MMRKLDCSFVFEWETPVVCPDKVKTLGCSVTDEQLHYTFNLTSLSGSSFEVIPSGDVISLPLLFPPLILPPLIDHCYQRFKSEQCFFFIKHPGVQEETEACAAAVVSADICLASDRGNNI